MSKRKDTDHGGRSSSSHRSASSPSAPVDASGVSNEFYPDSGSAMANDMEDDTLLAEALEQERLELLRQQDSTAAQHESGSSADEFAKEPSDDDEEANVDEDDNSEDEWRPPDQHPPKSRQSRLQKSKAQNQSSEDDNNDSDQDLDDDELAQSLGRPKKRRKTTSKSSAAGPNNSSSLQSENPTLDGEDAEFDKEAERAQAETEAAAAWAEVRKRQKPASQDPSAPAPAAAPSLTSWLGKGPSAASSVSELAAALPMPTTCAAAQIVDRSSLFVGYVYPLTTNAGAHVATLLSHLTRVVHPTVPVNLLPPQFANVPANKRGSSHDMYAYRVLQLKRGRTGVSGPDDYSLVEEKQDDGERWGGDRVLKVAQEEGASDVLVIVSRWYGGELLGPVRFEHIENAARASLQKHIADEEIQEFRTRIQYLDAQIDSVKEKLVGQEVSVGQTTAKPNNYVDLDLQKGQRLLLARQKGLEALRKRLQAQPVPNHDQGAVQEELNSMEKRTPGSQAPQAAASDQAQNSSPVVVTDPLSKGSDTVSNGLAAPIDFPKLEPTDDLTSAIVLQNISPEGTAKQENLDSASQQDEENGEDLTGWDEFS